MRKRYPSLAPVRLLVLFIVCAFAFLSQAHAQADDALEPPPVPKFTAGPVMDQTGTLSGEQLASLTQKLRRFEDSTTDQIAVLVVSSLNGFPISDYAVEVFDSNRFGVKDSNNGALLLVALNDHKYFISTGYGLEGALPDATASLIGENIFVPAMRRGDLYAAVNGTVDAMMQAVRGEFVAPNGTQSRHRRPHANSGLTTLVVLLFFGALIFFRYLFGTGAGRTIVGSGGSGSGCMGGILQGLFWSTLFSAGSNGNNGPWGGGFGGGGFGGGGGWGGGGGMTGGGGAGGGW